MSWLLDLYETYERNANQVGCFNKRKDGQEYTLLPESHTTQNAQIEVVVTEQGDFYSASVIEKKEAETVIPCTEDSFSRTSAPVPHPLHDKLMYVAGDFLAFGGQVKTGNPFNNYIMQLKEWAESDFTHPKIRAIYHYLKEGTLIQDLVNCSVLYVDRYNHLIKKWTKDEEALFGEKPPLFRVMNDTQDKVFVRFDVHIPGEINRRLWKDKAVYDSFIRFYKQKLKEKDFCYVTGREEAKTDKHSTKIRHSADMAKLISANDNSGYTFRGRFLKGDDVANISYKVSQKAHNALKWLILKQGKTIDGRVFLVWGNDQTEVPSPQDDLHSLLIEMDLIKETEVIEEGDSTHQVFAELFNKAITGFKSSLNYESNVMILILDAATPGRLSVLYYRNLNKEEYLSRIQNWHKTCSWLHEYKKDENKKTIHFYGAPATRDIAFAAYGSHASEKLVKGLMERMLSCVIDGRKVPLDIIKSAIHRASNPVSMDEWEWKKTLSITCALLKKHYEKEGYNVSLDPTNKNRDYLFGRLLALADVLERRALSNEDRRATNAIRYMNAFSRHPSRTWDIIQSNLQPYQARLGDQSLYLNKLIDEVASNIAIEDFNNKPLSGVYLLGFYSQRHELYKSKKDKESEQEKQIVGSDF
ncbi:type I-C CRISPR-associated protein Cas8c/Csd1 [Pullulanibacillus sp. KACC 23026]|uniref:type I-C CRISPR-associated protein Cas8c/Csd1 n=1 Tax=Pullulanibacillus sp. KACC 23026 TaxID=3028315 RepID=UPI0023AF3BC3|nr:type I-C CRISPR-associated protein Cas8c/Csd1 [Pullulanibacillus sp. KACC 23026]WEG12327.1 type I-C CRISPR-associated protein Cas8c/Csd1 [Pullulanibacillus sp. KACC 23026]